MGEYVLLSVNPQVWEAFLCRIENFCEVAEGPLFVQHLVCLGKLVSVGSLATRGLKHLTQALNLVQKALARSLPILAVQVILVVSTLLQMVTHHDRVFE